MIVKCSIEDHNKYTYYKEMPEVIELDEQGYTWLVCVHVPSNDISIIHKCLFKERNWRYIEDIDEECFYCKILIPEEILITVGLLREE